jgi:hypothetical protein
VGQHRRASRVPTPRPHSPGKPILASKLEPSWGFEPQTCGLRNRHDLSQLAHQGPSSFENCRSVAERGIGTAHPSGSATANPFAVRQASAWPPTVLLSVRMAASYLREGLVALFRERPVVLLDLLRSAHGIELAPHLPLAARHGRPDQPRSSRATRRPSFALPGWRVPSTISSPRCSAPDFNTAYRWPAYGAVLRDRRRCQVDVLAVCLDPALAHSLAAPIATGQSSSVFQTLFLLAGDLATPHLREALAIQFRAQPRYNLQILDVPRRSRRTSWSRICLKPTIINSSELESKVSSCSRRFQSHISTPEGVGKGSG